LRKNRADSFNDLYEYFGIELPLANYLNHPLVQLSFGFWWQLCDGMTELSKKADEMIKSGMRLGLHPLEKTIA